MEETKTEEETLPPGSIRRVCKEVMDKEECGFTSEYVPVMTRTICKLIKQITRDACDRTKADNRKQITLTHLKAAGEKFGIEMI